MPSTNKWPYWHSSEIYHGKQCAANKFHKTTKHEHTHMHGILSKRKMLKLKKLWITLKWFADLRKWNTKNI